MNIKKNDFVILYQGHTVKIKSAKSGQKIYKGVDIVTGNEYTFDHFAIMKKIDLNKQWEHENMF